MSAEGQGGGQPPPATIDNFDQAMANVDMTSDAGDAQPSSDDDGQQSLGSMFDNFAKPDDGVNPATGREVDAPPGVPTEGGEDGEPAPEGEEGLEAAEGDDGEEYEDDGEPTDADLLGKLELDQVIPEELMGRLRVKQKVNGELKEVSLTEATSNGMRLADYSRGKRELADNRREYQAQVENLTGLLDGWRTESPEGRKMTRGQLERMGIPIGQIAQDIAEEYVMLEQMDPFARQQWDARIKAEREAEEAREKARELERARQRADSERDTSGLRERVEAWRDGAFKRLQLHPSATTRQMFSAHLANLWDRSQRITEDVVRDAAQATLEEWQEHVGQHEASQATQRKATQRKKLRPKPTASAGGEKAGAQRGVRATLDNFDEFVAGR